MGSVSKKRNWAIFILCGLLVAAFFLVPYLIDLEKLKLENTLYEFFFKNDIKVENIILHWEGEIDIINKLARIVYLAFAVSVAVCIVLNIVMAFGGHKARFLRALQKIFYFIFGFISLLTCLVSLYLPIQLIISSENTIKNLIENGMLYMVFYAIIALALCILQFKASKHTKVQ